MDFLKFCSERWQPFNIAQFKKKCSTCPRWHQADFLLVGCTLPANAKKTSVMSQNEVELKKGTFLLNDNKQINTVNPFNLASIKFNIFTINIHLM